jgi:hypothetical protein
VIKVRNKGYILGHHSKKPIHINRYCSPLLLHAVFVAVKFSVYGSKKEERSVKQKEEQEEILRVSFWGFYEYIVR